MDAPAYNIMFWLFSAAVTDEREQQFLLQTGSRQLARERQGVNRSCIPLYNDIQINLYYLSTYHTDNLLTGNTMYDRTMRTYSNNLGNIDE